jgi:hypothetical protein
VSEGLKRLLKDIERGKSAREAGLRRELIRRLVETRKAKFVAAFTRQQRYYREQGKREGPRLSLEAQAECEGMHLATDPGWDAERAWNYSETRQQAIAELEAEVERRLDAEPRDEVPLD